MGRLVLFLIALLTFATPARADDVKAAERSVVRVVTIALEDDEVVGFGHGSGVVIAGNRIVTNAHVVAVAAQYPDNVVIGIVPSEGSKSYGARLIAFDPKRDLALLEMDKGRLPPATLYIGPLPDGSPVVALGYPGNVDLATARSADDYITPQQPTRADGNFSNTRNIDGITALLHTANIARGNSGGPQVDRCGRVLGINTFITHGEDGDAPFGFAIAAGELASFLREAHQKVASTGTDCISMEESLRAEQERSARERSEGEAAARTARERAESAALDKARAANQDSRENHLALAALLAILAIAAGGGGAVLWVKDKERNAMIAAGAGIALLGLAALAFFTRPARDALDIEPVRVPSEVEAPERTGKSLCKLVRERSRVTVSATDDVKVDWTANGCMNGRTQYARRGAAWSRILVPTQEQTVSVLDYKPSTGEYVVTHYLLGSDEMAKLRGLRKDVEIKACSADPEKVTILGDRQESIRQSLPSVPNERLVYKCAPE